MSALDKAVSTEDLCAQEVPPALGVLRLEAILNTLVENKVESLKQENERISSVHSSPKSILGKLKLLSSPKTTVRVVNEKRKESKRKEKRNKSHGRRSISENRQFKKQVLRQETSSPDSQTLHSEEKTSGSCEHWKNACNLQTSCQSTTCYQCDQRPVSVQAADDYITIKIDGYNDIETDSIIAQEELKRARKKRRRRRKRRLKKRLALNPHLVDTLTHDNEFKALHDDELPPRAKWTIVATACLLLFMCLLLVGITLRMAPLIDEMVREENEKLINSLSHSANASKTSVHKGVSRKRCA